MALIQVVPDKLFIRLSEKSELGGKQTRGCVWEDLGEGKEVQD